MNTSELKERIAHWYGMKEGSAKHVEMVADYNSQLVQPSGYMLKGSDPWCAAFVTVCYMENHLWEFAECSCPRMITKLKQKNKFSKKSDNLHIGDLIFYDWNCDGIADHVGIIMGITGSMLEVVEGNKQDAVGTRNIDKNNANICGFGLLGIEQGSVVAKKSPIDILNAAIDVIRGKYGSGTDRRNKLEANGFSYTQVQNLVNIVMK